MAALHFCEEPVNLLKIILLKLVMVIKLVLGATPAPFSGSRWITLLLLWVHCSRGNYCHHTLIIWILTTRFARVGKTTGALEARAFLWGVVARCQVWGREAASTFFGGILRVFVGGHFNITIKPVGGADIDLVVLVLLVVVFGGGVLIVEAEFAGVEVAGREGGYVAFFY